ncbi:MAG: nitronate monooxygenase [Verrucomicrobiota bacterium]|nr:nitronate monooxygenase [Verrucomicrobiota bacterium]
MIIDNFLEKGRDFLGVKYPIICGAMTWVSEPQLVAAVSNAGGFACLAGGNTPVDILEKQILETSNLTDKPFGINLITISPSYTDHLKMIKRVKPAFIIFAGSFPKRKEIERAKESGAKIICFASTLSIAKRMIKYGSDAIVLEGMEAGGHIGHVSLTVLLQQVLFHTKNVPVFVAGGISTGKMMAHLLMMGASGVQLGTRFVLSDECIAHENFKRIFQKANARDAISTPQFDSRLPVVAVRALRNKGTDNFGQLQLKLLKQMAKNKISREEAQLEVEKYWMGALRNAVVDGDVVSGSLMAGQSVGLLKEIMPVKEIINELINDAEAEFIQLKKSLISASSQ